MCDIESVNKIAKYLKVNPGKIAYNSDKVLMINEMNILQYFMLMLTFIHRSSLVQQKPKIWADSQRF